MYDRLVVGLTGMPGSGKSLAVAVAERRGYGIIVMGDVVREETKNRGLSLTTENIGETMLSLREKEGPAVISVRCIPRINEMNERKIMVDGIRSMNEVEEFVGQFSKFSLLAIHSSPETRFKRLYHRRRSDDPADWKVFCERDMRELSVGLGNTIALSELFVVNEGRKKETQEHIVKALQEVERKWTK